MHLCRSCQDWENWPPEPEHPVPALNPHDPRNARERAVALRTMCPNCGIHALIDRRLKSCERCAFRAKHCQHCGRSTVPEEARSADEEAAQRLHAALDLFTVMVKTYGYLAAHALLSERAEDVGGEIRRALLYRLEQIDERIHQREGLRFLYGQVRGRSRSARCANCRPPWHGSPNLSKAESCGHWTHGSAMALCLFCALALGYCANCGVTIT